MNHEQTPPRIGIGVILVNPQGDILLGKRKGSHAPYWSIPGGHLEHGESFEACAIREVAEETGLQIQAPVVVGLSNDLLTCQETGRHYISIALLARVTDAEPQLCEPDKCEGWIWCSPHSLPLPHFEASRQAIACWLSGNLYQASTSAESHRQ